MTVEHESIEFDVLFVGGGPANLAGAIHLMRLARQRNLEIEVALIEKGQEIGAHALSGAVLNPVALEELIPDYEEKGFPGEKVVRGDEFYFLTQTGRIRIPFVPRYMHNTGFHIVSLSRLTRWLGEIAEELGVNMFPGFAGQQILFQQDQQTVTGIRTGDMGIGKDGEPKGNFEPGIDLKAKITILGEGARGSLTKQLVNTLQLDAGKMPQVYETGIKEIIQLPEVNYFNASSGNDIHTFGYPLGVDVPGGGFIYEMKDNLVSIGLLVGLSYENPMLDPYDEFLKFKRHPFISRIIRGGKILEQGARTVSTGGYFSMPRLSANGVLLVGGSAGIHNTPALKGIHTAMKSGMLAAETCIDALKKGSFDERVLSGYEDRINTSWLKKELMEGRNFAQAMAKKAPIKFVYLGFQYLTEGRGVRDHMPIHEDFSALRPVDEFPLPETLPKSAVDGELFVDRLTGVYLSKTMHREDQPSHLIIRDPEICATRCRELYGNPCTRFCPGGVYETETDESTGKMRLKLNPANCLHCKTCDVKDPFRNITWTCPEGGGGPGYTLV